MRNRPNLDSQMSMTAQRPSAFKLMLANVGIFAVVGPILGLLTMPPIVALLFGHSSTPSPPMPHGMASINLRADVILCVLAYIFGLPYALPAGVINGLFMLSEPRVPSMVQGAAAGYFGALIVDVFFFGSPMRQPIDALARDALSNPMIMIAVVAAALCAPIVRGLWTSNGTTAPVERV